MKRNYSYLQGGNLPQKKLPKLNDQEIEKLYKFYSSKDKFHKKFQGTKRDYCYKATDLISNFLHKQRVTKNFSNLRENKLSGGVKFESTDTPERRLEKIKELIEIDEQKTDDGSVKKLKVKNVVKDKNIYTRGEFKEVGTPKFWGYPTNDLTYESISEYIDLYKDVLNIYVDNEVSQTNFLLAANFPNISDITPEGNRQRAEFSRRAGRKETGAGTDDWSDVDEAAYRTEYEYVKTVLIPLGFYPGYTEQQIRFLCLQKCFSEQAKYEVVDFPVGNSLYEEKGNKTVGARSKGFQVDTKKISEVIFNSFRQDGEPSDKSAAGIKRWKDSRSIVTNPKYCHISFFKYTDNSSMCNVVRDMDGNLLRESPGIPVEGIIDWDLTEMITSDAGKRVISKLKDKIEEYNKTYEPKVATKILKSQVVDDLVFGLVMNYFGTRTPSHIGSYKGGTKGLTTLTIDYNKLESISGKLNLIAYAPELLEGKDKTVSGFISAVKDQDNTDEFFITGSRGLRNTGVIEAIRKIERDTPPPAFPFIENPNTEDIFSLKKETDSSKDIKTKLQLITGEKDVTKASLRAWIQDSDYGHLVSKATLLPRVQDIVLKIFSGDLDELEKEEPEAIPEVGTAAAAAGTSDTLTQNELEALFTSKTKSTKHTVKDIKANLELYKDKTSKTNKLEVLKYWYEKAYPKILATEAAPVVVDAGPSEEEVEQLQKDKLFGIFGRLGLSGIDKKSTSTKLERALRRYYSENIGGAPEDASLERIENDLKDKAEAEQKAAVEAEQKAAEAKRKSSEKVVLSKDETDKFTKIKGYIPSQKSTFNLWTGYKVKKNEDIPRAIREYLNSEEGISAYETAIAERSTVVEDSGEDSDSD